MNEAMAATILVVDDTATNVALLKRVLTARGYRVVSAVNGQDGLAIVTKEHPDLVVTDIQMPLMDGHELCRRLRQDPSTQFLPVIMMTGGGEQERVTAIQAGADDFVTKPFNQVELLARVKSLLRIKAYHDQIEAQAAALAERASELTELNRTLEVRVTEQVDELQRLSQLRRFLSPQVAEIVMSSGGDALLENHRSQIAVVFTDLRGFTSLSETSEPEEIMRILREYHKVLGVQVTRFEGTVGFFAGDGLMVFFNDPILCEQPAARSVQMAVAMRDDMGHLEESWRGRNANLGFVASITFGYATLGRIGFEGRYDYTAIGGVVNQAARLCAEAGDGQIIVSQRVLTEVGDLVETEHLGNLMLKGFQRPVAAHNVLRLTGAT